MDILRPVALFLAVLVAPGGAMAQSLESRLHYDGEMMVDPDTGHIALDWTVTVLEPDLEAISFLLNPVFTDVEIYGAAVTGVEQSSLSTFGGEISIYTVSLGPAGAAPREIGIAYAGVLLPEPMDNRINTVDPDKIELTVDSFWLPFDQRFSPLTAELDIALPGGWSGVGVEGLVRTGTGFRLEQARPALDIAFTLMSRFERVEAENYVIYDTREAPGGGMDALVGALDFCTGYLNAMAGPAGPLPPASVTVNDRAGSGYSRGTLIALSDIDGEDPVSLLQFICHELAHYWSRGNPLTVENWLNESFADAMANMALRQAFGEPAFEVRLSDYRAQLSDAAEPLPPVWVPGAVERTPYLVTYRKGPLALARLETLIGRETFERVVQGFMREAIATTPDLLDLVEREAGADNRAAFEAMLAE